ncbi:ankyrin repeat domain-containing protein [Bradyrhizobium sp. USDA 4506]
MAAVSYPVGRTVAADRPIPSKETARNASQDQQSIELAKAIMAADPRLRDLIPGADPNAAIFINHRSRKYDLSLLTIAVLLGDEDAIAALIDAGARRGESCDVGYLISVSLPLNSILPEFTTRRAGLPRIMTGQAATSCFLASPYRRASRPSDQPLLDAVVAGNLEAARRAVSHGADWNAREQKLPGNVVWPGRTALMIALIERRLEIAEFLANGGTDVNAKAAIASRWGGVDGLDALKIAIHLKQRDMFKSLLEHGADATAVDEDGNWAIHEAASGGDTAAIKALLTDDPRLKARAAIVARNKSGETSLVLAVRSHRPDAVLYLVERGRALYGNDFLEYYGNGALDEVLTLRFTGSQEAAGIDRARRKAGEILTILLRNGADQSFRDEEGRTILMRSIQAGLDLDAIQSILDGAPQLDAVDRNGKDAYAFIQGRGDAKELEILLDRSRGKAR